MPIGEAGATPLRPRAVLEEARQGRGLRGGKMEDGWGILKLFDTKISIVLKI